MPRRTRITFTGFEPFWMGVAVDGLARRYSEKLDCSWVLWPSTLAERARFIWTMLRSDVVVRLAMPFEFDGGTARVWSALVRARRRLHAFNYWVGSDVFAFEERARAGMLSERDARAIVQMRHLASQENLAAELRGLGVPAQAVLLPSPELAVPDPPPPFGERFRVLSYWGDGRIDFYGGATVLKAAQALPGVTFDVVGATEDNAPHHPANVVFHGRVDDMPDYYARATVLVRLTVHDAIAAGMVEEALAFGRYVIYSFEWPHTTTVDRDDSEQLIRVLSDLKSRHTAGELPLNLAGRDFILKYWDPDARFAALRDALVAPAADD